MKQFFINMKESEIPWDKTDPGYSLFWESEKLKIKDGLIIDGYEFSGWLYWHLNHWKLKSDDQNEVNTINSDIEVITPVLRDNEEIINTTLLSAEKARKGITIMGLRQMGKTSFSASYGGRAGVIFKNSQNLLMGTSKEDLSNITDVMDFGLLNCTQYFRIPRITRDWDNERVQLGVKSKQGDNIIHSTYVIRNTASGKKTEKGAGVSNLKSNLWDEIGKDDFLSALNATKPAMLSANGWRTIPICTGTGGNVIKAQDAKKVFFNPDENNMVSFTLPDGRKCGLYMPGTLRQDCKYSMSFAKYLIDRGKLESVPEDSELWEIPILVSDEELAREKIKKELQAFLDANDISEYNRWKAYYPLTVDDIFLTESNNKFNTQAIKLHKNYLEKNYKPLNVELFRKPSGEVSWAYTDILPILKFPVKPSDNKVAPVCIYELPVENVPHGTYVIGIDPVNNDDSSDHEVSLASIMVFKRMVNPLDEFKNQLVASWTGRFKTLEEFHELAVLIAEFYNAINGVLIEASENTLLQYFYHKKKGKYIAETSDLLTHVSPNYKGTIKRGYPATVRNQKHGMDLFVKYANEEQIILDEEGNETIQIGLCNIFDTMLLTEMQEYKGKTEGNGVHNGNYDRVIAFYCALTIAEFYDIKYPMAQQKKTNVTIEQIFNNMSKVARTPFGTLNSSGMKSSLPGWMRSRH